MEQVAYVMAANLAVKSSAARVLPYVRRPVVRGQSVLDLRAAAPERRVVVPAAIDGHLFVIDALGARVLDANKPSGLALSIVTPPGREVFLHAGDRVFAATRSEGGGGLRAFDRRIDAGERLASKGDVEDEFRKNLFAQPLTRDFVAGLDAAVGAGLLPVIEHRVRAPAWTEDPITWTLLGTGAASAIFGAVSTGAFLHYQDRFNARPVTLEHERYRQNAETWRALTVGGYAAGGALLAAGIVRAVLTNEGGGDENRFVVLPSGAGLTALVSF